MSGEMFDRVAQFVRAHSIARVDEVTPETKLEDDLGIVGDDAPPFMKAFFDEFEVECDYFPFDKYFLPEGIRIPFITAFLYRLINGKPTPPPPELELTVGDLVRAAELGKWIEPDSAGAPRHGAGI